MTRWHLTLPPLPRRTPALSEAELLRAHDLMELCDERCERVLIREGRWCPKHGVVVVS